MKFAPTGCVRSMCFACGNVGVRHTRHPVPVSHLRPPGYLLRKPAALLGAMTPRSVGNRVRLGARRTRCIESRRPEAASVGNTCRASVGEVKPQVTALAAAFCKSVGVCLRRFESCTCPERKGPLTSTLPVGGPSSLSGSVRCGIRWFAAVRAEVVRKFEGDPSSSNRGHRLVVGLEAALDLGEYIGGEAYGDGRSQPRCEVQRRSTGLAEKPTMPN